MDALHNQVLFPSSLGELFSYWSRSPDAVPFAGGTSLIRRQGRDIIELPKNILSLEKLDELHKITRTERYLEIGAMVKLNEIVSLGKIVPEALSRTIQGIASPQVRNLATIGGNICSMGMEGGGTDSSAPMAALDARYELRGASQSRWISAVRFSSTPGSMSPQELMTRIRVPLEQWDYTVYKKIAGGVLIFLARNEKNILSDIRIVFSGESLLRDRNSETFLVGRKLPLDRKDVYHYRGLWETYLSGLGRPHPLLRSRLVNSILSALLELAD